MHDGSRNGAIMSRGLPSPRAQTAAWLALGALATVAVLTRWPLADHDLSRSSLVVLGGIAILASLIEIPTQLPGRGRDVQDLMALNEAALVLLLVTVPPGWAWFLLLCGYTATNVARHTSLLRNAFNHGAWSVSLAAAVAVHHALAGGVQGLTTRTALAATAAVATHMVLNYLAVELVVAANTGVSLRQRISAGLELAGLTFVGNLSLGLAGAALWAVDPWLSSVVILIALVLRTAFRQVLIADELADDVRVERDRLRLTVGGSTDGTVLVDHDGRVMIWNRTMDTWTGISEAAALGRRLDDVLAGLVTVDRPDAPDGQPTSLLGAPGTAASRRALRHRDGERRLVEVQHAQQHDRFGRVVADVIQLRDLTRQAEVERLKDDFLSRVSHELRTPLTAILGYARTLRGHGDRLADTLRADMQERIVDRGEQLEALLDDLLLVSSSGVGPSAGARSEFAPQALLPVVEHAVDEELAGHADRIVHVRATATPVTVLHAGWTTTAVRHLVANALRYSAAHTQVEVVVDEGPDGPTIEVRDHGRGIPASKLDEIFDRFTRIEDPMLMETGGAGVGLYVVDRLVQQQGGYVTVRSRLGEGSTFTIHLPHQPVRVGHGDATTTAA